jgi:uncharacterized membrane protein YkoI
MDHVTLSEARHLLLVELAEQMGVTYFEVMAEYTNNQELKRRVDAAALSLLSPTSKTIH